MIQDYDSDDLGLVCKHCCDDEEDIKGPECNPKESPDGKHSLVPHEMWVLVASQTLFDVDDDEVAMRVFSETGGGNPEFARKLTAEEFHDLRTGVAKLEVRLVRPLK